MAPKKGSGTMKWMQNIIFSTCMRNKKSSTLFSRSSFLLERISWNLSRTPFSTDILRNDCMAATLIEVCSALSMHSKVWFITPKSIPKFPVNWNHVLKRKIFHLHFSLRNDYFRFFFCWKLSSCP